MLKQVLVIIVFAVALVGVSSCAANSPAQKPDAAEETPAAPESQAKEAAAPAEAATETETPEAQPENPPEPEKPAQTQDEPPSEVGSVISERDYREFEAIGRSIMEAHKLYTDYFNGKANGKIDTGLLDRAIALLDNTIPRIEKLIEKYPDAQVLQEYLKTATEDRRALLFEK